jgi:hypothetical protein
MSVVTAEEVQVTSAIRQSFEQGGAGAVNAHPNPFFLNLNGSFDLLVAARLVIKNLDTHRAWIAQSQQKAEQEAAKKAAAANDDNIKS